MEIPGCFGRNNPIFLSNKFSWNILCESRTFDDHFVKKMLYDIFWCQMKNVICSRFVFFILYILQTYHWFVGIEFWLPPFWPDQNISIKLFLERVDFTQLQEGHVDDHLTLKSECACVKTTDLNETMKNLFYNVLTYRTHRYIRSPSPLSIVMHSRNGPWQIDAWTQKTFS